MGTRVLSTVEHKISSSTVSLHVRRGALRTQLKGLARRPEVLIDRDLADRVG